MKTSRPCSGMMFYENNAFKFLKTAKNTIRTCLTCTIVQGLVELGFSPRQSGFDHKHERNCNRRAVSYIFKQFKFEYR